MNLDVSTDGGATWINLWTQTGQVQTANADPFILVSVNLAAYSGNINLRWQGITGPDFNSDMAIDDIRIYDRPPIDVFVSDITEPTRRMWSRRKRDRYHYRNKLSVIHLFMTFQ